MAQKILIMGESGTGKSTSLRNLDPSITAIFNPMGKPLPFSQKEMKTPGKFTMLSNETKSSNAVSWIKGQAKAGKKIIVVDDFQYMLSIPYMNRIHESGWDKWNDFGADYFNLIDVCADLPDDVRVYYLTHTETLDSGITTIKLIGKLLREKITIEGLFTIVLRTSVIDQKYFFLTQNSGKDTVKSPMGMFNDYAVENDLAYIDDKICNYYEIGDYKSDAEIAAEDEEKGSDIAKPNAAGRRARGSAAPARKTRDQVEAENKAKMDQYMEDCDKAVDAIADGRTEIPFDEVVAATDKIPQPELETPPRRTRSERKAAEAAEPADTEAPDPLEGNMNPPEDSGRRVRRRAQRDIVPEGDTGTGTIVGATPQEAVEYELEKSEAPAAGRKRRRRGETAETPEEIPFI